MTHIILADMNGLEMTGLICSLIFGAIGSIVAVVALFKKQETVITNQPVTVELVKALHEQFAGKVEFEKLVTHTTNRHGQLFNKIDEVERSGRKELDKRITEINEDRRKTMEKLNAEFTFIRETLVELKTEAKIRNES